jgi:hypothetical protein
LIGPSQFQLFGLIRGEQAKLDERINPDGIEGGEIECEFSDTTLRSLQVARATQLQLGQLANQIFGRRFMHDAGIPYCGFTGIPTLSLVETTIDEIKNRHSKDLSQNS